MSRAYELMVIIDGDVEDPAGTVLDQAHHRWHRGCRWHRSTASPIGGESASSPIPINKKSMGYYLVVELVAEGGALDELERSLRLADDVVRHKLIRLPDAEAARRGMAGEAA